MMQTQRLDYLIKELLQEQPQYKNVPIPVSVHEKKVLLRSLFNVRPAMPASKKFLQVQDEYLKEALKQKKITDFKDLTPAADGLYLWQGDITTLKVDAIVNAANSQMLGCFVPCHTCIDNAIHTFAGIQLRLACADLMKQQGHAEAAGGAKITSAFNLPSHYVIHTVGPIVGETLTKQDCCVLADCYHACLELAEKNGVASIAFCCISTGVFHFPNDTAAEIAIAAVKNYREKTQSRIEVVFNVFQEIDKTIYQKLLSSN